MHRSRTDAGGGGDEAHWQLAVEHASNHVGSTRGGGSVMLMDVRQSPDAGGRANYISLIFSMSFRPAQSLRSRQVTSTRSLASMCWRK